LTGGRRQRERLDGRAGWARRDMELDRYAAATGSERATTE
jgi:hypothetical protein